jgi:hypothetical protein
VKHYSSPESNIYWFRVLGMAGWLCPVPRRCVAGNDVGYTGGLDGSGK